MIEALLARGSGGSAAVRPVWLVAAMLLAIGTDVAFQQVTQDVTPGLFLLPAVIAVAVAGGPTAGFVGALVAIAFAAIDLSEAGPLWQPPYGRAVRLAVLCVSAPAAAGVVGVLGRRLAATRAEQFQAGLRAERERAAVDHQAFRTERAVLVQQRDALADADRATQRRLADLIAAVPGVVWEAVVDGAKLRVAFISHYIQDLLGHDPEHWTGSDALWSTAVHPDDRDRVRQWLHDACRATPLANAVPVEFRWTARDGSEVWVETRLSAIAGPKPGDPCVALRGVTSDITARKRLEVAVAQRATELAAVARRLRESNAELDQFAYVASHDLKAPLRGMANLSTWIEEDLGTGRVTAEAHAQFDLLRGRVHRMERLIDGLLQFSQVGRVAGTVEWVDVNQLMAEVVDWVGPPDHVRVIVDPGLPSFNADRLRLGQVLANLVGNGVKHHGITAGWVRVSVTADPAMDGYVFAVADDGPGIDPRYHERIFGVFQTLRPRDQVEGTGIGLALVRKIVTAKGGTVAVESAAGQGATFRFTWPRVDPAAGHVVRRPPSVGATQEVPS